MGLTYCYGHIPVCTSLIEDLGSPAPEPPLSVLEVRIAGERVLNLLGVDSRAPLELSLPFVVTFHLLPSVLFPACSYLFSRLSSL